MKARIRVAAISAGGLPTPWVGCCVRSVPGRRCWIILEDVHWADQPALLLLQHVARTRTDERLRFVVNGASCLRSATRRGTGVSLTHIGGRIGKLLAGAGSSEPKLVVMRQFAHGCRSDRSDAPKRPQSKLGALRRSRW